MLLKVTINLKGQGLRAYAFQLPEGADPRDIVITAGIADVPIDERLEQVGAALRDGMQRGLAEAQAEAQAEAVRAGLAYEEADAYFGDDDGSEWAGEAYDQLVEAAIDSLVATLQETE